MRRRTVLGTIGAGVSGVAGCLDRYRPGYGSGGTNRPGTDSPRRDDGRTPTAPAAATERSSGPVTVSLVRTWDAALRETFGIGARVTVPEPAVTASATALVRVVLENATSEPRTLTYARETCDLDLIAGQYRRDERPQLLLVAAEHAWEWTEPDCPVPDGRTLDCGIPSRDHEITVAPDDPLEWQYRLWVDPERHRSGACLPSGTCRFGRTFRRDGTAARLTFDLAVGARAERSRTPVGTRDAG